MAIKGVIFDLGHTLMYLDSTWPVVFERGAADLVTFLEEQGLEVDGQAFAGAFLERRSEGFQHAQQTMREVTAGESMRWTFAKFGLPDASPALLDGAIDAFFAPEEAHWRAYPRAHSVLRQLADRGLRLGIYSNATHDPLIQRLVDGLGFRPWLDPALSSAMTGIRKPDPAAFAPFEAAWNLPPESMVVVGDTLEADIMGAQRAGMRCVWFPSRPDARQEGDVARHPRPALPVRPDATITELRELPACLDEL